MSKGVSNYYCNLCNRTFEPNDKKQFSQIYSMNYGRSKNYNQILVFDPPNKSQTNKHICVYCISDILNNFGE